MLNRLVTKSVWVWWIGTLYVIWTCKVIIEDYEPVRLRMVWSTKLATKIFWNTYSYHVLMFNLTKCFYAFRIHNFMFVIFVLRHIRIWMTFWYCFVLWNVYYNYFCHSWYLFFDNCLCCIVIIILCSDWLWMYLYASLHL
jgi:hypothetical protein